MENKDKKTEKKKITSRKTLVTSNIFYIINCCSCSWNTCCEEG